jgi:hypothetical protein
MEKEIVIIDISRGRVSKIYVPDWDTYFYGELDTTPVVEKPVVFSSDLFEKPIVEKPIVKKPVVAKSTIADELRGPIIGYANGQAIHGKVFDTVKEAMQRGASRNELVEIVGKFHEGTSKETRDVYVSSYKKHYFNSTKVDDNATNKTDDATQTPAKVDDTNVKKKRRRKIIKPEGSVGYSRRYGTWIKQDEEMLVLRAIRKWNFVATTKNIADDTRIRIGRIRAILDWLIETNKAHKSYDKQKFEYVYVPEEGKITKVSYP